MGKVLARHRIEMLMVFTFLGMWLIGELILQLWVPQYYFDFYPVIPVMFMVMTLINTIYIRRWEKKLDNG